MKKKYFIFILCLFSLLLFPSYGDTGRADINIIDFRIHNIVNDVVMGSFEVENFTDYYAPDLFYILSVVPESVLKINGNLYLSDVALYQSKPQKFSLSSKEIKTISFELKTYDFLYKEPCMLVLEFMDKTSFFFENAGAGPLYPGNKEEFLIPSDYSNTHYYKISGFEQPLSGPSFEIGKSPEGFIKLTSLFNKKVTVTPEFTIYQRLQSHLDSPVAILKGEKIIFSPSETKEVKLPFPALNMPGSYLVKVSFTNDFSIPVSYQYFFRYVVTGSSAKILNLSSSYSYDEQAMYINMTCVGPSDSTSLEDVNFSISAFNSNTANKITSLNEIVDLGSVPQQLSIKLPLIESGNEVDINIALIHNDKILDSQTIFLDKKSTTEAKLLFSDVVNTPYETSVKILNSLGIISGYPDSTYRPQNSITRAEFTSIALKLKGINVDELDAPKNIFTDIPDMHWANKAINTAYQNGIINGYGDNIFKPDNNITYSEALSILLNVAGFKTEASASSESWPHNYISIANDLDLLKDINISSYSNFVTRGDIAIMTLSTYFIRKV